MFLPCPPLTWLSKREVAYMMMMMMMMLAVQNLLVKNSTTVIFVVTADVVMRISTWINEVKMFRNKAFTN